MVYLSLTNREHLDFVEVYNILLSISTWFCKKIWNFWSLGQMPLIFLPNYCVPWLSYFLHPWSLIVWEYPWKLSAKWDFCLWTTKGFVGNLIIINIQFKLTREVHTLNWLLVLMVTLIYFYWLSVPLEAVCFMVTPGTGKTLVARALANECSQGDKGGFFMRKGSGLSE